MSKPKVILPSSGGTGNTEIHSDKNIVIVGANGSGKSRMGAWIEKKNTGTDVIAHRISAQRALTLPEYAVVKNYLQASNELIWGNQEHKNNRDAYRWQHDPYTSLLNDYEKVLSSLFASEAKRNLEYVDLSRKKAEAQDTTLPKIPDSPIDILQRIWKGILPQRAIKLSDGRVGVQSPSGKEYHGKSMSDGERVALYLIGQCLCAPDNSILIIDEPEIHLHKSLMSRLWSAIEEEKSNCLFIYITHDLDFASSRVEAKKIWVKSYDEDKWDWAEIGEIDGIPEALLLEIIGNRKKILFVEGEKGSLDSAIYQAIFPDFFVIPRGGCEKVIESTKAVTENEGLLHLSALGIIDRDFRTQEELSALEANGIRSIDVAEIENLLCIKGVLKAVAIHLGKNPDDSIKAVTDFVSEELQKELENQISLRTAKEVQFRLNMFNQKAIGMAALNTAKKTLFDNVDINILYEGNKKAYTDAIASKELEAILKIYNRKSLAKRISAIMGLGKDEYPNLVLRLLKTDKKMEIVTALKQLAPSINP